MKPAVFLDRDGTLIELVHYLADPALVRLIPGAAAAVRRLRQAGFACLVVTNQSAIGRGLLSVEGLLQIHATLDQLLAAEDTHVDGYYYCPAVPASDDPEVIDHPDRKPGAGLLRRAALEHGLDVARSWMCGDSLSDMFAGRNAACRGTLLVRTGYGHKVTLPHPAVDLVAADLAEGVAQLLALPLGDAPCFPTTTPPPEHAR